MNGHSLSGTCAYIKSFEMKYLQNSSLNVEDFVKGSFSKYSEEKKQKLITIFSKLKDRIKCSSDTGDIANKLFEIISE
jgi:hypothetical protein